jgi:lysophospholipase L1-like esterase
MLVITFLAIMLLATLAIIVLIRSTTETLIKHHHEQRASFFAAHPIQPGDIVFLGDSITDGAIWIELFPGLPVKNRGINADTTLSVLERMGPITVGKPKAIFILIGTNDLPWYEYRSDTDILETYEAILQRIQTDSPETKIFVQSIFPRSRHYARRIVNLNGELQQLARRMDCTYIDVFSHLAGPLGELRKGLHNDSLHLMAEGYAIWVEVLQPYMDELMRDGQAQAKD